MARKRKPLRRRKTKTPRPKPMPRYEWAPGDVVFLERPTADAAEA